MTVVRVINATPVEIFPPQLLQFQRIELVPGISVSRYSGPIARQIDRMSESIRQSSPQAGVVSGSHLLLVDQTRYFDELEKRLNAEGKALDREHLGWLGLDGVIRQVLMSATLLWQPAWKFGGAYEFRRHDGVLSDHGTSFSNKPVEQVSDLFRFGSDNVWNHNAQPAAWRALCGKLDRYYRGGTWWNDRLGVALGYLWSAVTTKHPELAFTALCMALEAIATTARMEVSHTLAVRCSLIARISLRDRSELYKELKDIYTLRSAVVHGRSEPKKGMLTRESLAITARCRIFRA